MALPTFLRHLRVLEDSGLVRSDKCGRVRTVHIDPAGLVPATEWLDRQRQQVLDRVDRLQALAEDLERATVPDRPRPPRSAP